MKAVGDHPSAGPSTGPEAFARTIVAGEMTKGLALLVGRDKPYLNTQDFPAGLDRKLRVAVAG